MSVVDVSDLPPALVEADARQYAALDACQAIKERDNSRETPEHYLAERELRQAYEEYARQLRAHFQQLRRDNPGLDVDAARGDILFRLMLHRRIESVACMLAIAAEHILFVPGESDGELRLPMTVIGDDEDTVHACDRALEVATGATTFTGSFAGWRHPTDAEPERPVAFTMMTDSVDATHLRDEVVLIPVGEVPDRILDGRIRDSISIDTYCAAMAKRIRRA